VATLIFNSVAIFLEKNNNTQTINQNDNLFRSNAINWI